MGLVKPSKTYAISFWRQFLKLRKDLPPGWMPHLTYWLIDDNNVVGQTNIRSQLIKNLRIFGGQIGYMIFKNIDYTDAGNAYSNLLLKKPS